MKYLLILNDPPYSTEHFYNGLRLAMALIKDTQNPEVRIFLLGGPCKINQSSYDLDERKSAYLNLKLSKENHFIVLGIDFVNNMRIILQSLLGDVAACAVQGQKTPEGYCNLERMVRALITKKALLIYRPSQEYLSFIYGGT